MKQILVTGSTGFIGKSFIEYYKRHQTHKYRLFAPSHQELDIMDKEATRYYLEENGIDCVVHLANTNSVKYDIGRYDILNMGLQMFVSLAEASDTYEKMIYFGSGAEYSRFYGKHLISEKDLGNQIPPDPYGFAKYIEAKLINSYDNIYDLCLFGVYGKYEEWQRRFISNNIVRSLKGLPMTLSQNAMFDYLYVDDLCKIIDWFIEHEPKHKHYNVCTSQPIDLLSLAKMINEVSGLDRKILVSKEGWQPEYSGDNSRLLSEIGALRFTEKKASIQKMWNYYAEHIDEFDEKQLLL